MNGTEEMVRRIFYAEMYREQANGQKGDGKAEALSFDFSISYTWKRRNGRIERNE